MASMAKFNAEVAPSLPLGRWDLASGVVRRASCEEGLLTATIREIAGRLGRAWVM